MSARSSGSAGNNGTNSRSNKSAGKPITYPTIIIGILGDFINEVTHVKVFSSVKNDWVELDRTEVLTSSVNPHFSRQIQVVVYPKSYLHQTLRLEVYDGDKIYGVGSVGVIELTKFQQRVEIKSDNKVVGSLQLSSKLEDNFQIDPTEMTQAELDIVFNHAFEEEEYLARKTMGILEALSRKWTLQTTMLIDVSDLCIRNLKNRFTRGSNDRYEEVSLLGTSNIAGVNQFHNAFLIAMGLCPEPLNRIGQAARILFESVSNFSKHQSVQAFAGGGVKPPSGDHLAVHAHRDAALPLVQELLMPKLVVTESWCDIMGLEPCRMFCGGEPISEDELFQYGSESDEDVDGDEGGDIDDEALAAREDVITPPALPDVAVVDPDGRLRANLVRPSSAAAYWGGRQYASQQTYRNQTHLGQGIGEAAALYHPNLQGQPTGLVTEEAKHRSIPTNSTRRRSSFFDVGFGYGEDFDQKFINMIKSDETTNDNFNVDIEALSQLLVTPKPKQVKLVTWVLGKCPSYRTLQRAQDLLRFMSMKTGGRVALLVILASEAGTHIGTPVSEKEAMPFKDFNAMFRNLMRDPKRPRIQEDDDRKGGDPANTRVRFWKQQVIEAKVTGLDIEYEAELASPRLLLVHMMTWIEVMDRAMLEEVAEGSNQGNVYPKVSSILKQFSELFPKRIFKSVRGDLAKEKRPDRAELRALQQRYESAIASLTARRINAFVHEVFYSSYQAAVSSK